MKSILTIAITLALTACAAPLRSDQARITISSSPPGATISDGVQSFETPQTLTWTIPGGKGTTRPITASWMSGAQTSIRLNLVGGSTKNYVFQRPNVAGVETDIRWAIHLQEKDAAATKVLLDVLSSTSKPSGSVRCTSTRIGTIVDTECK